MAKIVVIDYGSSNLHSVTKALKKVAGHRDTIIVSNAPKVLLAADKVVFPGQSAMGQCMDYLKTKALDKVIKDCILTKPYLGICLGLQSLMQHSDEDNGVTGLGALSGQVVRFASNIKDNNGEHYKVPAMGWNQVYQKKSHPLWRGIDDGSRFYFAHSYYVNLDDKSALAGSTDYVVTYASAVACHNIFATQFHPEKSQVVGLTLLQNFINWQV